MKASVGRIVHYTPADSGPCQGAMIVKAWDDDHTNLVVFRDGSNDSGLDGKGGSATLTYWETSVEQEPSGAQYHQHRWHEPERV